MPREVFPFEADRVVLRCFLRRQLMIPASAHGSALIVAEGQQGVTLKMQHGPSTIILAWFAPDGSLTMKMMSGSAGPSSRRLIEAVYAMLGDTKPHFTQEKEMVSHTIDHGDDTYEEHEVPMIKHFFNDMAVHEDEPITIAGPLTMMAYRARES